jgi:outer membrane protein assembly factor BamB
MSKTAINSVEEQQLLDPISEPVRRPRLWPAVLMLILQAVVFGLSITPSINNAVRFGMMMLGPAAGILLFAVWLMFGSRLAWRERSAILALLVLLPLGISLVIDPTAGLGMFLYGAPASMIIVVGALGAVRSTERQRLIVLGVGVSLIWALFPLIKIVGVRGDYLPELAWRWSRTPEQQLMDRPVVESQPVEPDWRPIAAPWPRFRGPGRDGQSDWSGPPLDWSTRLPTERWRIAIGPAWSSFSLVSGRLFTQEQRGDNEAVSCYDSDSGDLIWIQKSPARFSEIVSGAGPRATPTYHDGQVFTLGGRGLLQCLDASTGKTHWKHDLAEDFNARVPMWGFSGSPLVVDNRVFVLVGAADENGLVGFDHSTGEVAWSLACPNNGKNYCSPQLVELNGRTAVVFNDSDGVFAVRPTDGHVLWRFRPTAWNGPSVCQPHQLGSSSLITALGDGIGVARLEFTLESGGEWQIREAWSTHRLRPSFNDFVIHDGHIYGFDQNIFTCLDAESGERKWKRGRYGFGQVLLLPIVSQLIVVTDEGEVVLLAADPSQHREIGRMSAVTGKTWNHHVVADGKLFVRNGEAAVAFSLE